MLKMAVQQGAASEEARRTLQYVELLNDERAPLTDFFSRLLGPSGPACQSHTSLCQPCDEL